MDQMHMEVSAGVRALEIDVFLYSNRRTMRKALEKLIGGGIEYKATTLFNLEDKDKARIYLNSRDLSIKNVLHEVEHVSQFLLPEEIRSALVLKGKKNVKNRELVAEFVSTVAEKLLVALNLTGKE